LFHIFSWFILPITDIEFHRLANEELSRSAIKAEMKFLAAKNIPQDMK
tara:strand:+ start:101 stop:244 length:144 start_codon:yes stop_codon:yes gene_type:complete